MRADDLTPVVVPIGQATLRLWVATDFMENVFPDAPMLPSAPNYRDEDRDTAERCGYGRDDSACRALWLHHDPLHHWVSVQAGHPYSLTLWYAAQHRKPPKGLAPQEESMTLTVQAALNSAPTDPAAVTALERATGRDLATLVTQARQFLQSLQENEPC